MPCGFLLLTETPYYDNFIGFVAEDRIQYMLAHYSFNYLTIYGFFSVSNSLRLYSNAFFVYFHSILICISASCHDPAVYSYNYRLWQGLSRVMMPISIATLSEN